MFSVHIDDQGFTEAIAKAVGLSPKDFAPEYRRLGTTLLGEIDSQFTAERDPYGNQWIPLKPVTVIIKREKGSRNPTSVLQDTRRLRNSFKAEVLDDGLSLFTDRVFSDGITAEIHQFGGTHPRSQVFIPPRELLPFKDNLPTTWLSWAEVFHSIGIDRIFK